MAYYDCFNGDADGICALTQLRLVAPTESTLITGVKRDVKLLSQVTPSEGDKITVLDVSLDKNREDLKRVLKAGAEVFYCDHHFAGELPEHPLFDSLINTTSDVCTSLLMNTRLEGRYLDWAVVGTFGDNLSRSAKVLAKPLGLSEIQLSQLENLGVYLNYNGYGSQLEDLHFHPADLFSKTVQHDSAFSFINDDIATFGVLEQGYHTDMAKATQTKPVVANEFIAVYRLPNKAWARRVSGVFGNDLANQHPARAHAVITERSGGGFVVSVRAPLERKSGADGVCRQFETGGGRSAAAGINNLPEDSLNRFIDVFSANYSS